jgi:hypothetical protein
MLFACSSTLCPRHWRSHEVIEQLAERQKLILFITITGDTVGVALNDAVLALGLDEPTGKHSFSGTPITLRI